MAELLSSGDYCYCSDQGSLEEAKVKPTYIRRSSTGNQQVHNTGGAWYNPVAEMNVMVEVMLAVLTGRQVRGNGALPVLSMDSNRILIANQGWTLPVSFKCPEFEIDGEKLGLTFPRRISTVTCMRLTGGRSKFYSPLLTLVDRRDSRLRST